MSVNVHEDARAMRRAKGRHTISASEYASLVGHGTAPLRAASEPPDGYAIALDKQRRTSTTSVPVPTSSHEPPDGYAIALDEQRKGKK